MSSYKTRNPELIVPNAYADIVSGVEWLQENLAFSNEYVAELIEARQELFTRWKRGEQTLNSSQEQKLENFWDCCHFLVFGEGVGLSPVSPPGYSPGCWQQSKF